MPADERHPTSGFAPANSWSVEPALRTLYSAFAEVAEMINRLFVAVLFYFNLAATLGAVSVGVALAGVMPDLPTAYRLGSFCAAAALAYLSLRMARGGVQLLVSR